MGVAEPALDVTRDLESRIPTLSLDHDFPPVQVPRPVPVDPTGDPLSMAQPMSFSFEPEESTYLVRGEIADAAPSRLALLTVSNPDIVGVFADP
ncbi:MAG: peptidase S8, partial [Actinomycetota bacterium]|nr:peptidase S8 [Actinomycetota bacterium]